ncbi:MAG: hypothetical protein KQH83_06255 [Actinobacteria bacterium]|nr:hypothetical protein [Actinomycetota bacterium]
MRVRAIDPANRRDLRAFLGLPHRLYRDSPQWVPPMLVEERAELSPRRNPFYAHSEARLLVAEDGGEVAGRLVVMDHRPYNRHTGFSDALLDRFECVDDQAVAGALFDEAAAWARDRGLTRLSGPRRFMIGAPSGVLVEGFEHPPAPSCSYHLPYYGALFERHGFETEADLLSGYVDRSYDVDPQVFEAADAAAEANGYRPWKYPSRWALWRDRMTIARLFNTAFAEMDDFCPLDEAEMRLMARQMAVVADRNLIHYVRAGGDITAFLVMLPDISDGMRRARGRVLPFGWWHVLRAARRTRRASMVLAGVLPEHRSRGANLVLYANLARRAPGSRYTEAEIVYVDADNGRMQRNLALLGGVDWVKRHRVYRLPLGPAGS